MSKPKTYAEASEQLSESLKDLVFSIAKQLKIITLVKKIKFLELKDWVKERDK